MTASNTQTNITLHDIPLPYRDFLATDNSSYSFNQTFLDKEESFFINVLCYLADMFGISLTSSEADVLYKHFCSMREYNKVTNLTRITDTWSALVLHYLDSLLNMLVMQNLNINLQTQTILDLGTGAGFPGIPLSIKVPKNSYYVILSEKRQNFFHIILKKIVLITLFILRINVSKNFPLNTISSLL